MGKIDGMNKSPGIGRFYMALKQRSVRNPKTKISGSPVMEIKLEEKSLNN